MTEEGPWEPRIWIRVPLFPKIVLEIPSEWIRNPGASMPHARQAPKTPIVWTTEPG